MVQKYENKDELLKEALELLNKIKEDSIALDRCMSTFGMKNKSTVIIKILDDILYRLTSKSFDFKLRKCM